MHSHLPGPLCRLIHEKTVCLMANKLNNQKKKKIDTNTVNKTSEAVAITIYKTRHAGPAELYIRQAHVQTATFLVNHNNTAIYR